MKTMAGRHRPTSSLGVPISMTLDNLEVPTYWVFGEYFTISGCDK